MGYDVRTATSYARARDHEIRESYLWHEFDLAMAYINTAYYIIHCRNPFNIDIK